MVTSVSIQLEDVPKLVCVASRYTSGGRPAVLLHEADTGEPWCDLTVNLPDYIVPDPETDGFVPTDRERYLDVLADSGYAEVIGECRYGGFGSRAYMVRFADALLARDEGE